MTDRTTDRDRQAGDRTVLSVPRAAERLGITPDAVRARLHRGTLAGEKAGGAWRVFFPTALSSTGTQQDATGTEQDADRHGGDVAIARLEAENAYLRQVLDAEIEARRRADHLVAALMERLPELPATVEARNAPQSENEGPQRADGPEMDPDTLRVERETPGAAPGWRRWWRRIAGG